MSRPIGPLVDAGATEATAASRRTPTSPDDAPEGRRPWHGIVLGTLAVALGWSALCNLAVNVLQAGGDLSVAVPSPLTRSLPLFAVSTFVVLLVLVLLVALTARVWVPCGLLLGAAVLLGAVDHTKLVLRDEPLYPSDLTFVSQLGFVSDMVTPGAVLAIVVVTLAAVLAGVLPGRLLSHRFPPLEDRHRRYDVVATRAATVLVCALVLGYLHGFNDPSNRARALFEGAGARWAPWSQSGTYLVNGFVAGTLFNLDPVLMHRPDGYGRRTMQRLADRYAAEAAAFNAGRDPAALDDTNVVVVLSESFSDPARVAGVRLSRDPIPFTRSVMGSTASGSMLTQHLGGGTANVEFEALTGMSVSELTVQASAPYQVLVPRSREFPSAARYLTATGHRAIGVHPFSATTYGRDKVYPRLGFADLVDQDHMRHRGRAGHGAYISDDAAFREVTDRIATSRRPLFVNLVTMQNHRPYGGQFGARTRVGGVSGDTLTQAQDYVGGLERSDAALRRFLSRLTASGEPTAVVFYGDHLPGFWPGDLRKRTGERAFHET
ncbi:MAG: LTA synthase family protein, partial [Nocardioidaceae bacterium]|nr:LTA synthase family protein [Nocardioidaceae bacterium]